MAWLWGMNRQASARYERLFREARRQFDLEVKAIVARHAADGQLQPGKTIKVVVRALDDATLAAISDALAGIAAVTDHAGAKRKRLLNALTESLLAHHVLILEEARAQVKKLGLGSDFRPAIPPIWAARERHDEKITDFREGWTAPAGKPWKDRHPIIFALIVALIGIAVGWAGKSVWDAPGGSPTATGER